MTVNMLAHALAYAKRGWPVFPCSPESKQPLVAPDKVDGKPIKGTGGLHKATTVEEQIRLWWKRWPNAMIGVPMGARSGVFAIDLDLGEPQLVTGDDYLERFTTFVERLPETAIAETASGGIHIYFRWENDQPVKNNGKRLVPALTMLPADDAPKGAKGAGIDCRGEGGYVIVPPSVRADGKAYRWRFPAWTRESTDLNVGTATPAIYDVVTGKHAKAHVNAASETASAALPLQPPARETQPAAISRGRIETAAEAGLRKYCESALDLAAGDLRAAVAGERQNQTNTIAFSVGTLVGTGHLAESAARHALQTAVMTWGPLTPKLIDTIERGLVAGIRKPRDLGEIADKAERRAAGAGSFAPPPVSPGDYEFFSANAPNGQAAGDDPDDRDFGSDDAAPGAADNAAAAGGNGGGRVTGRGAAGGGPRRRGPSDDDDQRQIALHPECAFLPQTDLGNAERFVARNKGRLLSCSALSASRGGGGWFCWNGQHWARDGADERVKIAEHEMVRHIQSEAEWLAQSRFEKEISVKHRGKKDAKGESIEEPIMLSDTLRDWGRASEENSRLTPISRQAAPYLAVRIDQLDADPFMMTVRNGTLIVHPPAFGKKARVEFRPHDPRDLITKMMPIDYDPEAECEVYDEFLSEVQPHKDMRRFLHQWGGLSLTADISEQRLVFFWGKGRNGKSTLLEIWAHVAGDYGGAAQIETFVNMGQQRNGGQATPDLAMLRGKRFIHTNEPEKGAKISESLVKLVTGGDTFPARELNCPFFPMRIVGKITMSGNFKPKIEGGDASHGIWRRMTLVPWNVTVEVDKVDKALPEKLKREASGILNRLIDGLLDWLDHGLMLPKEVVEATEKYREDSDPLGRFISACTEPGTDNDRVQSSVLHRVFCAWAKLNGEREWTTKGLGLALAERQYKSHHSNVNYWLGIRLTVSVDAQGRLLDAEGKQLGEVMGDDPPPHDDVPDGPAAYRAGQLPDEIEFT
jgi:putative DNA primase/helicase